jgi:hypothetical protein
MSEFKHSLQSIYGEEILFRSFQGVFTAEKEIQMLQSALDEGLIGDKLKGTVIDFCSAQFNMEIGDVYKIIDFVNSKKSLRHLKFAIIVDTPEKIIHPLLGGIYKENIKVEPFSTREAAIEFVIT